VVGADGDEDEVALHFDGLRLAHQNSLPITWLLG
jgi:hypothetical protein